MVEGFFVCKGLPWQTGPRPGPGAGHDGGPLVAGHLPTRSGQAPLEEASLQPGSPAAGGGQRGCIVSWVAVEGRDLGGSCRR